DNISESKSENCSNYSSDYKSDSETNTIKILVPKLSKVEEQISNIIYSTEQ
ncbi:2050_t:CDS:1, partial [Scutellospora calospora]